MMARRTVVGSHPRYGHLIQEVEPCGCWTEYWSKGPNGESGVCSACQARAEAERQTNYYRLAEREAYNQDAYGPSDF